MVLARYVFNTRGSVEVMQILKRGVGLREGHLRSEVIRTLHDYNTMEHLSWDEQLKNGM